MITSAAVFLARTHRLVHLSIRALLASDSGFLVLLVRGIQISPLGHEVMNPVGGTFNFLARHEVLDEVRVETIAHVLNWPVHLDIIINVELLRS